MTRPIEFLSILTLSTFGLFGAADLLLHGDMRSVLALGSLVPLWYLAFLCLLRPPGIPSFLVWLGLVGGATFLSGWGGVALGGSISGSLLLLLLAVLLAAVFETSSPVLPLRWLTVSALVLLGVGLSLTCSPENSAF
jgi:hypothetical protein